MVKKNKIKATEEDPLSVITATEDGGLQKHSSLDTKSLRSLEVYTEIITEETKILRDGKWVEVTNRRPLKMILAKFENRQTGFAYPMWYDYEEFMELNPDLKDILR
jgi:hypothetical protein